MKERKTIKINDFQLPTLLNEEELKGFRILQNNSYCYSCMGEMALSNVQAILLNDLNDIEVQGTCLVCGGKMARYMEFGEDQDFSNRAESFRKHLK